MFRSLSVFFVLVSSIAKADPVVFTDCDDFEWHINHCPSSVYCMDSNFQPVGSSSTYTPRFSISNGLLKFECVQLTDCPSGTFRGQLPYEISCPATSEFTDAFAKRFSELKENSAEQCGSIVGIDNQTLGERIPLVGAKFDLTYFTHMSRGRAGDFKLKAGLNGSTPVSGITSYKVRVSVGSDFYGPEVTIPNGPSLTYDYTWDGKDLLGNYVLGPQNFSVTSVPVYSDPTKQQIPFKQDVSLGTFDAKVLGLGGWMPSIYRFYSAKTNLLFGGDGSVRKVVAQTVTGQSGVTHSVSEVDGSYIHFFDSVGRLRYTKLGLKGTTVFTFNYNSNGTLASIAEPFSLVTNFVRDAQGKLEAIVAPRGTYTPAYCAAQCYQEQGTLVTMTVVNGDGLLTTARTLGGVGIYQFTYEGAGLLKTFRNQIGAINTFTYDANGNLIKDQKNSGYFFDLVKNVLSKTSYEVISTTGAGLSTRYQISDLAEGNTRRTTTYPDGLIREYTFSNGSAETSFAGIEEQVSFASDPRLPGARYPSSESVSFSGINITKTTQKVFTPSSSGAWPWNIQSLVTKEKISNSETVSTYDGQSTIIKVSPLGVNTTIGIDSYERTTSVQQGSLSPISYGYSGDQLTSVTHGNKVTNLLYDSMGFLQEIRENNSLVESYTYYVDGKLATKVDASGFETKFFRDAEGNVTSIEFGPPPAPVCGPRGCRPGTPERQHLFSFNLNEAISSYSTPIVGSSRLVTTFQYNIDKMLTKITRPSGKFIENVYQPGTGVLTKVITSDGEYLLTSNSVNGKISSVETPKMYTTFVNYSGLNESGYTYLDSTDAEFGRYSSSIDSATGLRASDTVLVGGNASQIQYTYDLDFNLKTAGDQTISYDSNGQVQSIQIGSIIETFSRNNSGKVTMSGVDYNGQNLFYEIVGYNNQDRIGSVGYRLPNLSDRSNVYTYSAGRLSSVQYNLGVPKQISYVDFTLATPSVLNNGRTRVSYNGEVTDYFYSKDDRLEKTILVNSSGTLTTYYAYQLDGELSSKTVYSGVATPVLLGRTEYTYDVFGNLVLVKLPDNTLVEYEIDGLNRRIGKKVNGSLVKRWIYQDRTRIVAELNAAGVIQKRFVYGTKRNVPDYMVMNGENYKIVSNHQGSVRAIIKASDGTVIGLMDHDEFGKVLVNSSPGLVPFGFAGGHVDEDTGLVRFGARDYDPEVGRWTAKDPILFNGGDTNLYGYVSNDPANWIDPEGLSRTLAGPNYLEGMGAGGAGAGAISVSDLVKVIIGSLINVFHDKKLSDWEIQEMKKAGVDPEKLKKSITGHKKTGSIDLWKSPNGDICVKPKDGSGPGEPTGWNINDILGK